MKKVITLAFAFIILFSLSACSNSVEDIYGYWKSEKVLPGSGKYEVFIITENSIGRNEINLKNITFSKEDDIWVTSEYEKAFGVSVKYGFKILDKDTLEAFTCLADKQGNKINPRGIFKRITKEEAEKIITKNSSWIKPSVKSPF